MTYLELEKQEEMSGRRKQSGAFLWMCLPILRFSHKTDVQGEIADVKLEGSTFIAASSTMTKTGEQKYTFPLSVHFSVTEMYLSCNLYCWSNCSSKPKKEPNKDVILGEQQYQSHHHHWWGTKTIELDISSYFCYFQSKHKSSTHNIKWRYWLCCTSQWSGVFSCFVLNLKVTFASSIVRAVWPSHLRLGERKHGAVLCPGSHLPLWLLCQRDKEAAFDRKFVLLWNRFNSRCR